MAIIPAEEKVFMVSNSTNTTYSGSAALKAMQQWYTMEDVTNTVRPYQVFTALLTQSGSGSTESFIDSGDLSIGTTYYISANDDLLADFTNVGASNNEIGTYFIATGTTPNSWGTFSELGYVASAPVATVLENTIGNIWFTYTIIGRYQINSINLFTTDKTTQFLNNVPAVEGDLAIFNNIDPNILYLSSANSSLELEDGYFNATPIEIRVYN
jgi:hypothetical protein